MDIKIIQEKLAYPTQICIVAHRNPDGDALGAIFGLANVLRQDGHMVHCITPSEFPPNFAWLPEVDSLHIYDLEAEQCNAMLDASSILFALDFNSLDRIDKLGAAIAERKLFTVMIDHHVDPEPFADVMISETTASSTCELVYQFIQDMDWSKYINDEVRQCIYAGLNTDTGSFKHNTNPRLFRQIAEMLSEGLDDFSIQDKIYNQRSEKELRILGHCLANRMELIPELKTGIIWLTAEDYMAFDIGRGDTEGIVNYPLSLKGIEVSVFIMQQPTIVKLSLRSKGDISVQALARDNFNGGGHVNASGGHTHASIVEVKDKIKRVLPNYI